MSDVTNSAFSFRPRQISVEPWKMKIHSHFRTELSMDFVFPKFKFKLRLCIGIFFISIARFFSYDPNDICACQNLTYNNMCMYDDVSPILLHTYAYDHSTFTYASFTAKFSTQT